MVADEGDVGVGLLEFAEGRGLGKAVDSSGERVALVYASGGVEVDGAVGPSINLAARGGVPVGHRMGNGGRSRLGSCVGGGAVDGGEGGLDIEGEAGVVGVGAGGGVEGVVGLGGAVGNANAELAVPDGVLDLRLSHRR